MSDFKAKMHQIQFRLGLRPRPPWGSLQCSPDPLAGFKGPTSNGREGKGVKGRGKERMRVPRLLRLPAPGSRGARIVTELH